MVLPKALLFTLAVALLTSFSLSRNSFALNCRKAVRATIATEAFTNEDRIIWGQIEQKFRAGDTAYTPTDLHLFGKIGHHLYREDGNYNRFYKILDYYGARDAFVEQARKERPEVVGSHYMADYALHENIRATEQRDRGHPILRQFKPNLWTLAFIGALVWAANRPQDIPHAWHQTQTTSSQAWNSSTGRTVRGWVHGLMNSKSRTYPATTQSTPQTQPTSTQPTSAP